VTVRARAPLSFFLVVLMSCLVVLQPISVYGADCSNQNALIVQLGKDISRLRDDLNKQKSDEAAAQRDLAADLKNIDAAQKALQEEAPRVQQELNDKGTIQALKTLAVQVLIAIAIGAAGPEGYGLLGHTVEVLAELADHAYTSYEVGNLLKEGVEAAAVMDEINAGLGNIEGARAYAEENNLTEFNKLLDMEEQLAALIKKFDQDWNRLKFAHNAVLGDQALLDKLARQLADAFEAYWACMDKAGPVPSECEGQPTNPNGAGVCR
jgi:cell division FtsZ-interacting protein ZapD